MLINSKEQSLQVSHEQKLNLFYFKPPRFGVECYCDVTQPIQTDTLNIFDLTEIEQIFLCLLTICAFLFCASFVMSSLISFLTSWYLTMHLSRPKLISTEASGRMTKSVKYNR